MKITEEQLKKMVNEAIEKKLQLAEGRDFTAKRQIVHSAEQASMAFEQEMISSLNLVNPDDMSEMAQRKYYEIVEEMKQEIKLAVEKAVKRLAHLPRNESGEGK